jgi:hypothetical protein
VHSYGARYLARPGAASTSASRSDWRKTLRIQPGVRDHALVTRLSATPAGRSAHAESSGHAGFLHETQCHLVSPGPGDPLLGPAAGVPVLRATHRRSPRCPHPTRLPVRYWRRSRPAALMDRGRLAPRAGIAARGFDAEGAQGRAGREPEPVVLRTGWASSYPRHPREWVHISGCSAHRYSRMATPSVDIPIRRSHAPLWASPSRSVITLQCSRGAHRRRYAWTWLGAGRGADPPDLCILRLRAGLIRTRAVAGGGN